MMQVGRQSEGSIERKTEDGQSGAGEKKVEENPILAKAKQIKRVEKNTHQRKVQEEKTIVIPSLSLSTTNTKPTNNNKSQLQPRKQPQQQQQRKLSQQKPKEKETPVHRYPYFRMRRAVDLCPVSSIWVTRSTHSDVMTVTTTSQVVTNTKTRNGELRRIQLPTFMEERPQVLSMPPRRKIRALVRERDLFMNRLRAEREGRSQLEHWAAVKLQTQVRGFLVRPKPIRIPRVKEPVPTESIREQLARMARDTEAQMELDREMSMKDNDNSKGWRQKISKRAQAKEERNRLARREKFLAVFMQKLARGFLVRCAMKDIRERALWDKQWFARVEIQRISRGWLARRFVGRMEATEKYNAARSIQRLARGTQGRAFCVRVRDQMREETERDRAATLMQKAARGKLGRRRCEKQKKTNAAVKIQRISRGKQGKRKAKKRRARRTSAATKIQSLHRGRKAREEVHDKRRVALEQEEIQAAETIQRAARSHHARKKATAKRKKRDTKAATQIQAAQRSRQARKEVAARRQTKKETEAATKIQSVRRGKEGRRRSQLRKEEVQREMEGRAAIKIQSVARQKQARSVVEGKVRERQEKLEEGAATRIQSIQRGKQARKELERERGERRKQLLLEEGGGQKQRKKVRRRKKQT